MIYKISKLSDVGTLNRGKSKHRPRNDKKLFNGKYPFIQTGDIRKAKWLITDFSQSYNEFGLAQSKLWDKGTLCITIAANIADTAILNFPACFPDSVLGFIPDSKKSNLYYIDYLIRKMKYKLDKASSQTTQKNINLGTFENLTFELPNIEDQNKIASLIVPFDEQIFNNDNLIKDLEEYIQLQFHKWFIDYNFPNEDGNPYKDSSGEMMKIGKFELPIDFKIGCLDDISIFYSGYSFDSNSYIKKGIYSVITIKNVQDGEITTIGTDMVDEIPSNMPKHCKLDEGDILISLTGNVGRVGLNVSENALLNQRISKILPKHTYEYEYLYALLRNRKSQILAERLSNGSAQQNLSPILFAQAEQIIPPAKLLIKFSYLTKDIINKIIMLKKENIILEEARDLLIRKLIR